MNHRDFLPGHKKLLASPWVCQFGSPDMNSPTLPYSSCSFNFWGHDIVLLQGYTLFLCLELWEHCEDRVLRIPDFRASITAISADIKGRYLALLLPSALNNAALMGSVWGLLCVIKSKY